MGSISLKSYCVGDQIEVIKDLEMCDANVSLEETSKSLVYGSCPVYIFYIHVADT